MKLASAGSRWIAEPVDRRNPGGSWWVRSTDNSWPGVCAGGYLTKRQAEAVAEDLNRCDDTGSGAGNAQGGNE